MDNEQLLHALSNMIDEKLDAKFDEKLAPINTRLDKMDSRLDKLESEVSALKVGQTELRKELKEVNIKVTNTYQLALDAWGTSTENRRWLENGKATI